MNSFWTIFFWYKKFEFWKCSKGFPFDLKNKTDISLYILEEKIVQKKAAGSIAIPKKDIVHVCAT